MHMCIANIIHFGVDLFFKVYFAHCLFERSHCPDSHGMFIFAYKYNFHKPLEFSYYDICCLN